jgi:hypothetical protein
MLQSLFYPEHVPLSSKFIDLTVSNGWGLLLIQRRDKYRSYVPLNKTIILPVVLYGCETCSLTLREEHRLKVFENRVLRSEEDIWTEEG